MSTTPSQPSPGEPAGYSALLDVESALSAPDRCPGCGTPGLRPLVDGEQTHFRCAACGRVWHVELGWVTPVTPESSGIPEISAGH